MIYLVRLMVEYDLLFFLKWNWSAQKTAAGNGILYGISRHIKRWNYVYVSWKKTMYSQIFLDYYTSRYVFLLKRHVYILLTGKLCNELFSGESIQKTISWRRNIYFRGICNPLWLIGGNVVMKIQNSSDFFPMLN